MYQFWYKYKRFFIYRETYSKPGDLSTLIDSEDKDKITELTVTGNLNSADILFIREMAGADIYGNSTAGNLQVLDLSGASIVAGGGHYLNHPDIGLCSTDNNQFNYAMFAFCTKLKEITVPTTATSDGMALFYNCIRLESIHVPATNPYLASQDGVFFDKNKKTLFSYPAKKADQTYTVPASVETIKLYSFNGSLNLREVVLPAGLTNLEEGVFSNCYALETINIPNGLTEIPSQAFTNCYSLSHIELPTSLQIIGNDAFKSCNSLGAITIPNSVETIETYAFKDCSALQTITVPDGMKSIKWGAFEYCSRLTDVELPASLTNLGGRAFGYCESLAQVKVMNPTPLDLDESTFDNVPFSTCELIVPTASVAAYQAAPVWNQFFIITKVEESIDKIESKVFTSGNHIVIKDADIQSMVDIYSITGSLIKSFIINSTYETIELPTGNMYIIKLNGINYKVVM